MSDAHWWLWFNAIEPIVKSLLRWSFLYVGSWHPSDVAVADNLSSGQGIASGRYALDAEPYDAAARGASRVRAPNRTTSLTALAYACSPKSGVAWYPRWSAVRYDGNQFIRL